MAFTSTPTATPTTVPLSAYLPNRFVTSQVSANDVVWAFVDVYINTVLVTTLQIPRKEENPANTHIFEFDVQRVLRDSLAPFSTAKTGCFDGFNTASITLVPELHCEYYVEVTYKYIDSTTGLLVDLGVTDTSVDYYAIAATRQRLEAQNFSNYIPFASFPNNLKWLTNAPKVLDVCQNENRWLCFIADAGATKIRVRTYLGGVLQDEGYFDADTSPIFEIETVGVGIPQLSLQTYTTSGGAPTTVSFTGIDSYTVELSSFAAGNPIYLETRTFNIVECCGGARLHWLNPLAGADAYTFKNLAVKKFRTDSERMQKPLSATYDISDRGLLKLSSNSNYEFGANTGFVTPAVADWLVEVLDSVEVYLETDGGLLPVVVESVEQETQKDKAGELNLVAVKVVFVYSNPLIKQHN